MDRSWRDVSVHEAGHWILCEALGVPVSEVFVDRVGTRGHVRFDAEKLKAMMMKGQEGSPARWPPVVVAVAGGVAECLAADRPIPEDRRSCYSGTDWDVVVNVGCDFGSLKPDGSIALDGVLERAEREAREILQTNWDRVIEVAETLRAGRVPSRKEQVREADDE